MNMNPPKISAETEEALAAAARLNVKPLSTVQRLKQRPSNYAAESAYASYSHFGNEEE